MAKMNCSVYSVVYTEDCTDNGMVVSVNGTVVTLVESDKLESMDFSSAEMPEGFENFGGKMPEGFENFSDFFGGEMPEGFSGQMPGGFPGGQMPAGGSWGSGETPQMPEGGNFPGGSFPGGEMPEGGSWGSGQMPSFGGSFSGFENFAAGLETTDIDIGDAHISVENDGIKESGDLDSLTPGSTVTITMNAKGKVTYVLVSAQSYFGGRTGNGYIFHKRVS